MKIVIGSRGSKLALWQANFVKEKIEEMFPEIDLEIKVIKTKGDKILDAPLSKIGSKGIFTREIEHALLRGEIDIAVHSLKDLPTQLPDGLTLAGVTEREDVRDVLISKNGLKLSELPQSAVIATGSLRRKAQLLHFRKDFKIVNLRGNVDTRFRKFYESSWDGMVLAYAGVKRMNYEDKITEIIPTEIILPAAGQGSIAMETRKDNTKVIEIIRKINHRDTELAITAERTLLSRLEGGCQVPIGVFANVNDGKLKITAMISSLDGNFLLKDSNEGEAEKAEEIATELAEKLLSKGAGKILKEIKERQ